jgi:biotin operon repressor
VTAIDLPAKKNKRDKILELVSNGNNYSAQQIADIVGTTAANVWKEKSKLRASGALVKRRKIEQSTRKMSDETIILSTDEIRRRDNTHYEHMNITALDNNGLMELYKEFNRGRKPCDIIAEHGFHPEVVEKEYNRFLQLNERDPDSLQKAYIPSIDKYVMKPIDESDALFSKYKTKGYLNNNEFIKLLKLKSDYDQYHGIGQVAYNERVSHYGYTAIKCKNCSRSIPDVIVNINSNIGKKVLESYKTLCYTCYLKVEDDDDDDA